VIWLFVVFVYPKITRNNTSRITKEPGIQEAFNYGIIFFSKRAERLLNRRIEIVDPLVKDLNIDKLVGPGRNRGLRLPA
jgi:hypothetical protein